MRRGASLARRGGGKRMRSRQVSHAKHTGLSKNACEAKRTKQPLSLQNEAACHCKNDSAPARALEILNRETALFMLGPTGSTRARSGFIQDGPLRPYPRLGRPTS